MKHTRSPRRSGRLRRRTAVVITASAVVAVAVGAYAASVLLPTTPLPEFTASEDFAREVSATENADLQSVVTDQTSPSAVGWTGSDEVWSTDESTTAPLASLSKLVTVLVCLEESPLDDGDGFTVTWTDEDLARTEAYLADEGVAYPIPVGTEVTQRQLLTMALLPSANDFAAALAVHTFGDMDTFLTAVENWQQRQGIDSLTLVEPTGMDSRNVASAADLVRIARLAVADPTITSITSLESAELPWGIGTVENTNPLLGKISGVTGLKTGRTTDAGYNLVASREVTRGGRDLTVISVALGRESPKARASDSLELLRTAAKAAHSVPLVAEDERIGTLTTADGTTAAVVAANAAETVLAPGDTASLEIGTSIQSATIDTGSTVATISASAPGGAEEIAAVTTASVSEPTPWWRLTHPRTVWDW